MSALSERTENVLAVLAVKIIKKFCGFLESLSYTWLQLISFLYALSFPISKL